MKKAFNLFIIILCLTLAIGLTSCDSSETELASDVDLIDEVEEAHVHDETEAICDVPAVCMDCGEITIQALEHEPKEDDGDCTTSVDCAICGEVLIPAATEHVFLEDDNDCTTEVKCENCDEILVKANEHRFKGEWLSTEDGHYHVCRNDNCTVLEEAIAHVVENFTCTECAYCFPIDARELTPEELNLALTTQLEAKNTDIYVLLLEDAPAEMLDAVRSALLETPYVSPGSISLTLAGIKTIHGYSDGIPAGEYIVTLGAISLPDVVSIGDYAFDLCINLTELNAPKVQTIGKWAFANTNISSIELPEATSIGYAAFMGSTSLTRAVLPKATNIGEMAFDNTALSSLTLLSEDEIIISESALGFPNTNSEEIDLVLSSSKVNEVLDEISWLGFEFKSISFED